MCHIRNTQILLTITYMKHVVLRKLVEIKAWNNLLPTLTFILNIIHPMDEIYFDIFFYVGIKRKLNATCKHMHMSDLYMF